MTGDPRHDHSVAGPADDGVVPHPFGPAASAAPAPRSPGAGTARPESAEPEATDSEGTNPDATEPVATEPVATEPVATESDATGRETTEADGTGPAADEAHAAEPDVTEADVTEADVSEAHTPEPEVAAAEQAPPPAAEPPAAELTADEPPAAEPDPATGPREAPTQPRIRSRRRRDPLAATLIGVLTLLLGFAFAVQVRNTDQGHELVGAREEDLVRILDEVNSREERLREQIAEQRTALEQLNSSGSRSSTALEEARRRAQAIGILNGTIPARGPGLIMTVRDPGDEVRVADILDAIQELRGAGAETMQIDGVRVGVSTAVTGTPGALMIDGHPLTAPYEFLVIGSPQDMETAMNIPGGVVPHITSRGGTVSITQSEDVQVDALRPLDTPQYASPSTGN